MKEVTRRKDETEHVKSGKAKKRAVCKVKNSIKRKGPQKGKKVKTSSQE